MKEFVFFVLTFLLGGTVGSMVMCLKQIKNMKVVLYDREEEEENEKDC